MNMKDQIDDVQHYIENREKARVDRYRTWMPIVIAVVGAVFTVGVTFTTFNSNIDNNAAAGNDNAAAIAELTAVVKSNQADIALNRDNQKDIQNTLENLDNSLNQLVKAIQAIGGDDIRIF